MDTQKIKYIQICLSKWRQERHISMEQQKKGLLSNLLEELTEISRATSEEEIIDGYCDCIIFLLNTDENIIWDFNEKEPFSFTDIISLIVCPTNKTSFKVGVLSNKIEELGYNTFKCLLETIKEISSRTGKFDKTINKFVKDTSDEAKAKWYKADYKSCKEV